jgi:hypothetical protein
VCQSLNTQWIFPSEESYAMPTDKVIWLFPNAGNTWGKCLLPPFFRQWIKGWFVLKSFFNSYHLVLRTHQNDLGLKLHGILKYLSTLHATKRISCKILKLLPVLALKLVVCVTEQNCLILKAKFPIKIKWISFYISLTPLISNRKVLIKTQHKSPYHMTHSFGKEKILFRIFWKIYAFPSLSLKPICGLNLNHISLW